MNLDPGIVCFVHCSKRVFCLDVPCRCPLCGKQLGNDVFPFRVPYPFVRAAQLKCAVVIKATDGSFLRDYNESDDLHIGVTSSRGALYEFDERGLTVEVSNKSWDQSLLVLQETEPHLCERWDENLQQVAAYPSWIASKYRENGFNCYDFVMSFLQTFDNGNYRTIATSKEAFIENQVSPVIGNAMKYVKLYRQVVSQGFHFSDAE